VREYLAEVTNQIFFYLNEADTDPNPVVRDTKLALAAGLGCATFRRLHDDARFHEYVARCSQRYSENQDDPMLIQIREEYSLLKQFMEQETEILIRAGVKLNPARQITDTVLQIREQYSPEVLRYRSSEEIFSRVEEHKSDACNTWEQLRTHMTNINSKNAIRRVGLGIGGATMIAANAAADIGIVGLSLGMFPVPVMTALSGAAGGSLLGNLISKMFP
jgi:hypothetical protein